LGGDEDAISKALDGGTNKRSSRDVVAEALGREPKKRRLTFAEPPKLNPSDSLPMEVEGPERMECDETDESVPAVKFGVRKRQSGDVIAEALGVKPAKRKLTSAAAPNLIPPEVVNSSYRREDELLEQLKREGVEEFTSTAWCRGIIDGAASKDDTEAFVEKITKRTARGLKHGQDLLGELSPCCAVADVSIDPGDRVGRPLEVDCQVYKAAEGGTYQNSAPPWALYEQSHHSSVTPRGSSPSGWTHSRGETQVEPATGLQPKGWTSQTAQRQASPGEAKALSYGPLLCEAPDRAVVETPVDDCRVRFIVTLIKPHLTSPRTSSTFQRMAARLALHHQENCFQRPKTAAQTGVRLRVVQEGSDEELHGVREVQLRPTHGSRSSTRHTPLLRFRVSRPECPARIVVSTSGMAPPPEDPGTWLSVAT
jgi:hypothetical protein